MTVMQELLAAGYPREQMYHWQSDLYVFATPLTKQVLEKYYRERHWNMKHYAPIFTDQITGRPMYDIAFGNDDWMLEKAG